MTDSRWWKEQTVEADFEDGFDEQDVVEELVQGEDGIYRVKGVDDKYEVSIL